MSVPVWPGDVGMSQIHVYICMMKVSSKASTSTDKYRIFIVKLGSRSKVYLKSLRDLDLELVAIIAMSPPTTTTCHHPLNFSEQNNIEISLYVN